MLIEAFKPSNHAIGLDNFCKHRSPTAEDVRNHRAGLKRLGFIYITKNGYCNMVAIDIDDHHKGKINKKKYLDIAKLLELPITFAESKSGGLHAYLRLDKPYKALYLRNYLKKLIYALNPNEVEEFPKQDTLGPEDTGNWLNLPYFGNKCSILDFDGNKLPYEEGMQYLISRTVSYKKIKPLLMLSKKDFPEGRNNKTWAIGRYAKKVFGEDKIETIVNQYNAIAFEEGMDEREINQTILKSNEKKDYFDHTHEEKIATLQDYCINQFRLLPIERPKYYLENLFRQKSINFVGGPKGRGKTEFCLGMSYSVVHGKDFLKWKVNEAQPVYYIDGEMDPTDIWDREAKYRERFGAPLENYFKILNYQTANEQNTLPDIKDESNHDLYLERFDLQYKQTGKKPMIFFDNLRSLSNFNENSSDEYNAINKFFLKLKAQGYTVNVVDHTGKSISQGFRGTSGKTDNAYVCLILDPEKDTSCLKFTVCFDKGRGLKPELTQDYTVQYTFDGCWSEGKTGKQVKADATECEIAEYLNKGLTQKQISKKMDMAVGTVNKYCQIIKEKDKNSAF